MGSVKKVFKKATKVIKKPISKITKGIARGVAKVAKSVMKGVGKLNAKLGPIGMIAMSIAMPYAMGGLSNMIGRGAMSGIHGPTGWMGSKNVFLRSIGNVGNAIRTGYNGVTGAIGRFTKGITRSITEGFSKMSGGKGNGLWSKISNGAKNLFTRARDTVKKFTPKFRQGTSGTVDVSGYGNPFGYNQTTQMTSGQASQLLKSGAIDASQLSNQTLGSAEGWWTKAGSSEADKLVTETLNSTFDSTIGGSLDTNGSRWINDLYTNGTGNSRYANKWDAYDSVKGNNAWRTTSDGTFVDLSATGDYTMGTTQPGKATEYNFNGNKSFNTKVSNTNGIKKKVEESGKKWIKKKAIDYGKSLFNPAELHANEYEGIVTSSAEFADGQSDALTSSSLQEGATGSSSYANVFGTVAWEKLKGYHRNMNYQGDMDYYGVK